MSKKQAFQAFQSELHISYSQIFTYLACSLKYQFQYVEQRPHEHVSIALPFGSAIHSAIERYYRSLKETGVPESLEAIQEVFKDHLAADLEARSMLILYKKETPDTKSVIEMGNGLLKAFYEGIDMTGFEVAGIELPLTARLFNEHGEPMDMVVTGIIDLLLKDAQGNLIAVDNKTAKQPYAQATVDEDLQLTSYAYLLASNKFVFPTSDVYCRFDVMRKLKKPKFEQHYTVRTAAQRRRFAKVTNAVLAGIDARVFIPNSSWMCGDCQFGKGDGFNGVNSSLGGKLHVGILATRKKHGQSGRQQKRKKAFAPNPKCIACCNIGKGEHHAPASATSIVPGPVTTWTLRCGNGMVSPAFSISSLTRLFRSQ